MRGFSGGLHLAVVVDCNGNTAALHQIALCDQQHYHEQHHHNEEAGDAGSDWRLACQVKVKGDMDIEVPASVLDVREWECEVISNRNVATFIKEFIVALPPGEHMDFIPGRTGRISPMRADTHRR